MALKDWNRIQKHLTDVIAYRQKMGNYWFVERIEIYFPNHSFTHTSNYVVIIVKGSTWLDRKEFKIKSLALKFAKQYMRTH